MEKFFRMFYRMRFKILGLWGALVGALAWSGISSWTHVVPKWLLAIVLVGAVLIGILCPVSYRYCAKHEDI